MRATLISAEQFSGVRFKLTGIHQQDKNETSSAVRAYRIVKEMEYALTALRLLQEGYIGIPTFFVKGHIYSSTQHASSFLPIDDCNSIKDYPKYILSKNDISKLAKYIKILQQFPEKNPQKPYGNLTVALRRFNQIYLRRLYEDQIIDLCIALESCLLADSKAYKAKSILISTRGAKLLIKNRDENETKNLLLQMYKARNDIIYEGKLLSEIEKKDTGKFYLDCENVTREILREFIIRMYQGETIQAILKRLTNNC